MPNLSCLPRWLIAAGLLLPFIAVAGPLPQPTGDTDFLDDGTPRAELVELGRLLFFDKILSGNGNIACASCHHPLTGTGDGLSLPVGEGGRGLGVTRDTGTENDSIHERVPRNSPPLFNLGARAFVTLFHDGRVAVDPSQPSGFLSPAGDTLPDGLASVLAVQAMFPVTSATEMAGQAGENAVADAAAAGALAGPGGVWELLAQRLREIPVYVDLFVAAFDAIDTADDIAFVHAANAIAAFEAVTWRADNSPFDRYLRGQRGAMSRQAKRGMRLFYGKAGCARCHGGVFQTGHEFAAIAMPQIGPGKGDGLSGREDFGRARVTGLASDRFRFRVPTLRNVALTAPYGHGGAYATLEAVVRHHLDPIESLERYDVAQRRLPPRTDLDAIDVAVHEDPDARARIAAVNELRRTWLGDEELEALMDFLLSLTDPASLDTGGVVPSRVPSGLPVAD